MRIWFCIPALLAGLAGCGGGATVSENQCVAGDWQTLGYRDGARGYRSSSILAHQDACGEHGIVPDRHGYMLGWEEGVREYCQANNGFAVGEHGYGHNNVCPDDLRADFLTEYHKGRSLYLARSAVARLERELVSAEARLETVKGELVASAAAQFSGTLLPAERVELIAKTQRLHEEQKNLEYEIGDLERELELKEQELAALDRQLAAAAY